MMARAMEGLRLARVAFTGRLASMSRRQARRAVEAAGGVAVEGVSRRTSVLVVGMDGWPLLPDGTLSRKLCRAEDLNRAGSRIRIISEADFLELAGLRRHAPALRKSYPAERVGELVGIDPATLRRWELLGLVRSSGGQYDFQDIVSLKAVAGLVAAGADPRTISKSVRGLASVLPGTDRPLSQLRIVAGQPGTLLAELGDRLVAPDGQLVIDFEAAGPAPGDSPPSLVHSQAPAADWLERGRCLEDQDRFGEAVAAYRRALAEHPGLAEAHFNLGNALRGLGRLEAAEERYRTALDHDDTLAEAWYNLADVLEETGRLAEAVACLQRAVAVEPSYADAHFNLASCLELLGRDHGAAGHWHAYLDLDGSGEWADLAREHLGEYSHEHA